MDFPLTDLMDQDACCHKFVALLHPAGLAGCHWRLARQWHPKQEPPGGVAHTPERDRP